MSESHQPEHQQKQGRPPARQQIFAEIEAGLKAGEFRTLPADERVRRIARLRLANCMDPHTIRKYVLEFQLMGRTLPSLTAEELQMLARRYPAFYHHILEMNAALTKLLEQLPEIMEKCEVQLRTVRAWIQTAVARTLLDRDNSHLEDLKGMTLNMRDSKLLLPLTAEQVELVVRMALSYARMDRQKPVGRQRNHRRKTPR